MERIKNIFNKKVLSHILFWGIMLAFYMSSAWPFEKDKIFLFERMFFKVIVQIAMTYTVIEVFLPKFLNKKKYIAFALNTLIIIYLAYVAYTAIRCFYLLPKYPEIFSVRPPLIFTERITNGFAFLNNITSLVFPTIILIVFEYYRHQKEILSLREQKKMSELTALKNQLNPHFLFNTLNNLYTLTLKKSDKAPELIERLSEILDYILYRCKDQYVPLESEVKLLDNYIALEKLRYGKRLKITFIKELEGNVYIAPLLLLIFLENAFKHGVSEAIDKAYVDIELQASKEHIYYKIKNTKPYIEATVLLQKEGESIGLMNIKKQLDILYPNAHILKVDDQKDDFTITLNLTTK